MVVGGVAFHWNLTHSHSIYKSKHALNALNGSFWTLKLVRRDEGRLFSGGLQWPSTQHKANLKKVLEFYKKRQRHSPKKVCYFLWRFSSFLRVCVCVLVSFSEIFLGRLGRTKLAFTFLFFSFLFSYDFFIPFLFHFFFFFINNKTDV